MFVVKPRTGNDCQKELRAIGVCSSVCHCQHVGPIKSILLWPEFILESTSPNRFTSCTVTIGTSSLVHEIFYDSMENHPVVVSFLHQFDEVLATFRTIFEIKKQMDISHCCLKDYFVIFLCHFLLFFLLCLLFDDFFIYNISL